MDRWHAYLKAGKQIIEQYDGRIPLSSWLRQYFREHKKAGAKDRKFITGLLYSYFRLGHSAINFPVEERMLAGLFLSQQSPNELLDHLQPGWNKAIHLPLQEKLQFSRPFIDAFQLRDVFPWQDQLSKGIDPDLFNLSLLQQPDLFLRIRPGKLNGVKQKLSDAGISFLPISDTCISLANATNVDEVLEIDREVVVQDLSSQNIGPFYRLPSNEGHASAARVWDCCAASGGKSIMVYDQFPSIHLTVSDVREPILLNLQKRFSSAGIKHYRSFVTDLAGKNCRLPDAPCELIIADLPCTGSGTWARTPEQLYFFDPKKILHYADLQKKIISNVIPALKTGSRLVYSTCSVFREENESIVKYITRSFPLQLDEMKLLAGYPVKADSMFVAVFSHT